MKKIEPKQDYILCEIVPPEQKNIITVVKEQAELMEFRVLSVGPGRYGQGGVFIKPDVEPGDVVILSNRGSYIIIEDPKVEIEDGFQKSGGKLLISWESVAAKVKTIQDDAS